MKRNKLLLLSLFLSSGLVYASVYKHVDEQGNVTYSNVPSVNSKQIDLPPIVVVPSVDSREIDDRIIQRRESNKNREQREQLQSKIAEEEKQLNEIRNEYKEGVPDRLGSERNYQRYLDRVERLKNEIGVREKNLNALRDQLQQLPINSR